MKAIACVIFAVLLLQGCAVNVVTVNLHDSNVGYEDSANSGVISQGNGQGVAL